MLFKRINREAPERVFMIFQNNEGSTLPAGAAVQMDLTTDVDGVKIRQPDTGHLHAFVGVNDASLADDAFGLVQVYGYRSSAVVFQTNTTQDAGLALVPTAGQDYLASVATTTASTGAVTLQPVMAVLAASIASSSASATIGAEVFIRAL